MTTRDPAQMTPEELAVYLDQDSEQRRKDSAYPPDLRKADEWWAAVRAAEAEATQEEA